MRLFLLFCCCHPDLAPPSQVAPALRAVGGLTRDIADAFYVPEATMAQRFSRAKRALPDPARRCWHAPMTPLFLGSTALTQAGNAQM